MNRRQVVHTVQVRQSIRLAIIVVLVATATLVLPASAARACSCGGDPPKPPLAFEGTAIESLPRGFGRPLWRFRVIRADRGANPGSEVDVLLWVPQDQSSTSCDISRYPMQLGARYRVTASVFTDDNGARHFTANQCGGGSLELLSAYARMRLAGRENASSRSGDRVLAAGGALTVALLATTVLMRRASRPSR